MSLYGRYQVSESPSALRRIHIHRGGALHEVDHEPRVLVIDQSNLVSQGIHVDEFIPGARRVDALGSCTANATTSALSNLLDTERFAEFVYGAAPTDPSGVYADAVSAERAAIKFYFEETHQTGDPAQEWPPTDCGSSGPYIVSELQRLGLASGDAIAHGADSIVSLLQTGGLLMGSPWLMAWETPDARGFVDGDGSADTLYSQIQGGVAGGHETYVSAVEKLALTGSGRVDAENTVVRVRNSWGPSWGDHGSCRFHLSTIVTLGQYVDLRQLRA